MHKKQLFKRPLKVSKVNLMELNSTSLVLSEVHLQMKTSRSLVNRSLAIRSLKLNNNKQNINSIKPSNSKQNMNKIISSMSNRMRKKKNQKYLFMKIHFLKRQLLLRHNLSSKSHSEGKGFKLDRLCTQRSIRKISSLQKLNQPLLLSSLKRNQNQHPSRDYLLLQKSQIWSLSFRMRTIKCWHRSGKHQRGPRI